MQRLHELFLRGGQSPWLDNLDRRALASGELRQWIADGIRGVTSNPTIFANAMSSSDAYDDSLGRLIRGGADVATAYWRLAEADIAGAADLFRPVYDESDGVDGYVSLEVDPHLAQRSADTVKSGVDLATRLGRPNVLIKVPATAAGIPAIEQLTALGINVNVTLIFGLDRYREVIEAYLSGLERREGSLADASSVASFFISRVDTEVDRRLETIATTAALECRGKTAIAQARMAYQIFEGYFAGDRWQRLADRGARAQRPLWASTSTKNPAYPDTLYVDELVGPNSVNTLPETTLRAFADHGQIARRIDHDVADAAAQLTRLDKVGIDRAGVATQLENEGVASFAKSFDEVLQALSAKADTLR